MARTWGPLIKWRLFLPIFLNNVSNLDASVQTATLPLTTALTLSPPWLRHKSTYIRWRLLRASMSAIRSQVLHAYHLSLPTNATAQSRGSDDPHGKRPGARSAGGIHTAQPGLPAMSERRIGQSLADKVGRGRSRGIRIEEHTSELQSLMRNSYAVFCLKKKTKQNNKGQG